jgi:putative ABC transport system permease protein
LGIARDRPGERAAVGPADFLALKEGDSSFAALSAFRPWNANLPGVGDPERVQARLVTREFFAVLGIKPSLGRTFVAEAAEPGRPGTLTVSHGFWTSRLASDASAIGKTVALNGGSYTIVGVMPEQFTFPLETEMWLPLTLTGPEEHDRASHSVSIIGRLKPGIPVAQARAELATLAYRLASEYPATNQNRSFQTLPQIVMAALIPQPSTVQTTRL